MVRTYFIIALPLLIVIAVLHPSCQEFYAISNSSETVYKIQHTTADRPFSEDLWFEIMVQSCPAPAEKNWQNWRASTNWSEMNLLPKIALAIGVVGLCLLLVEFATAFWQGVSSRLFLNGKNTTTSPTETSAIF